MSETRVGRPRESQVPRQERQCNKHGITTHSGDVVGGGSLTWRCMACAKENSNRRYHEKKAGIRVPTRLPTKVEKEVACCKRCFLALNALGECGECD